MLHRHGPDSGGAQRFDSVASLGRLTGWVHDAWFDLDEVAFDARLGVVTFPLRRGRRRFWIASYGGRPWGRMAVRHAQGLEVDDRAQVGRYDIGEVTGDESLVVVRSNAPCAVRIRVERVMVTLDLERC